MAQTQSNINVAAPGFSGINTQRSPTQLGPEFASVADNSIIDRYGRVGCRKGFNVLTTSVSALGGKSIEAIHYHGNGVVFSAGNFKVFRDTEPLLDITPAGATIVTNQWQIISFNKSCYFFAVGNDPLVYDDSTDTLTLMTAHASFLGPAPTGGTALAGFGRVWVGKGDVLQWSDTLAGVKWSGGSTGQLDMNLVWPNGYDEITAVTEHNNFLIIFGRKSIVIYSGANDPATMALSDTISGLGCVGKFAYASTGGDLVFIDYSGIRSLGRTIQEKSVPIGDISANVANDIKSIIVSELADSEATVTLQYVAKDSYLLAVFSSESITYCFDMRGFLEDGSARTTIWPVSTTTSTTIHPVNGDLYTGSLVGVSIQGGYLDGVSKIPFKYYSNPMEFGQPVNLKMLKQVDVTVLGGTGVDMSLAWAYDYASSYKKQVRTLSASFPINYGVGEYAEATSEYTSGAILDTEKFNTNGSGVNVTIGIEANIDGEAFSIQALNFQALIGRII